MQQRLGWWYSLSRFAIVLAAFWGLSGCNSLGSLASPEFAVQARAQERWDALVAGDFGKAYTYLTPAYRETVDLYGFRRSIDGFIKYQAAEVLAVACDDTSCKVRVRIRFVTAFEAEGFGATSTDVEEVWVNDGDGWWKFTAL